MKRLWRVADFAGVMMLSAMVSAGAHTYLVKSPDHHQTFSYGSETHQQWITRGPDRHLAISMDFTNDPYVDRNEPRQYDDCVLDFPAVQLSSDGKTFYYHAPSGRNVAVAERYRDFLGISEIRLRSNAELLTKSPHGYLTAYLLLESS